MKKILLSLIILSILLFSNCATVLYGPYGNIFTSTTIGNFGNGKEGSKTGEACAHSVLGIVAFGDASIKEAKSKAQINDITSVDHSVFVILGVYGRLCTIVKGN